MPADPGYRNYRIDLETAPTDLKIVLRSRMSPDFYGLTLDGDRGISLDNVAMRGASGTVFTKLDRLVLGSRWHDNNKVILEVYYMIYE